jgi:hypothetical protein
VLHWQLNANDGASVCFDEGFQELALIVVVGESANEDCAVVEHFTLAFVSHLYFKKRITEPDLAETLADHVGLALANELDHDVGHPVGSVGHGDCGEVLDTGDVQIAVHTVDQPLLKFFMGAQGRLGLQLNGQVSQKDLVGFKSGENVGTLSLHLGFLLHWVQLVQIYIAEVDLFFNTDCLKV